MLAVRRTDKVNAFLTMLAGRPRTWHAPAMPEPRTPRSAGILFAILPLAGAIGVGLLGEPVIGLLGGLAFAALLSTLFWLHDQKR